MRLNNIFRGALLVSIVVAGITSTALAQSTKFSIGDRVVTTSTLRVRTAPTSQSVSLGVTQVGATGAVVGGPVLADGRIWWQINYDTGPDGWSWEGGLQKIPGTNKFAIGNRVKVTMANAGDTLNVRTSPSGTRLGRQQNGALGTVVGGPISANGNIWWNINYDASPDGWSIQNYLTLVTPTTPPPPAPAPAPSPAATCPIKNTYTASADFSAVQGQNCWSYRDSTDSLMSYDTANSLWRGAETWLVLWSDHGQPGNSADAIRRWTAPVAGAVQISGNAYDLDTSCGAGAVAQIKKGSAILWQSEINAAAGVNFNVSSSVAQNDTVDFVLARGADGNNYCDTTYFNPTIVLTLSGTTPPPPAPAPTPPPAPTTTTAFDFSLTNGGNRTVIAGSPISNTISAQLISGTQQFVTLTISGIALTAPVSATCVPTCTLNMTLTIPATLAAGNYPITATAVGGGVTRTTSFTLTVIAATPAPTPPPPSSQIHSLSVSALTVAPGGTNNVSVQNNPSNPTDWVALAAVGSAEINYFDWQYLSGTKIAPASAMTSANLVFAMPQTAGQYEFRLFAQNGTTRLATSSAVTVTAGTPAPTPVPPPPASTKFIVGDKVQVLSGPLNVRATANGTLLGTQATNALGTVSGGPTNAGGFNWWTINFDVGVDGWSAEDFLVKYTAPAPSPSVTYITPGIGSFTDAAGNIYTLSLSGEATQNGAPMQGGGGTSKMAYDTNTRIVYAQDSASGAWYTWNQTGWVGPVTAPPSSSTPPPPTPTPPPPPPAPAPSPTPPPPPPAPAPAPTAADRTSFMLSTEMHGPQAYTWGETAKNIQNGLNNAFTFGPPADSGMSQFFSSNPGIGFLHHMYSGAVGAETWLHFSETSRQGAYAICSNVVGKNNSAWNLMPEWDQSGGGWVPNGRPRYSGQTRNQAYSTFTNYYLNTYPTLNTYLQQSQSQRGCRLIAQTDYAPNAFYAYQLGVDVNMLERAIDELGDISTGLAYIRGAGKQYDRPWGIDLSTWRTSADSATSFDANGKHIGGWSPNYLRRHLYSAFLAGAHLAQIEATLYYLPSGVLNPFGTMMKEFADFSLRRHPNVGRSAVKMAVMQDFYASFDTKHGPYNQADAVWYQDIPYSDGDYMINNFFKVAYPNHWLHGTTPNAPFNNDPAGYKQFLANGGDPRPYEPMPFTRWGDNLDVILNNAGLATLQKYKVIALLGNVPIGTSLMANLQTWVQGGGTLVINAAQASTFDQAMLGVQIGAATKTGTASKWLADNGVFTEPSFQYRAITPLTATVLANNNDADPLITSNNYGLGKVILTAPLYLQSAARDRMLGIGTKLFDSLNSQHALATVSGPQVEYIVNEMPGKIIVGVINNSGSTWNGSVLTNVAGTATAVREYLTDTNVNFTNQNQRTTVTASVPAYDVRVYAIDYTTAP